MAEASSLLGFFRQIRKIKTFGIVTECPDRAATILALSASAEAVEFQFSDGIEQPSLKAAMEQNVSKLFTDINEAKAGGTDINFSGIDISDTAVESLASSWNTVRFATEDDFIVDHCVTRRELAIDFTTSGRIDDVNFAMENTEYARMLAEGNTVGEVERRMQILDWCEKFKGGVYWLYLPQGTDKLTIQTSGFLPLRLRFDPVKSLFTYHMTVAPKGAADDATGVPLTLVRVLSGRFRMGATPEQESQEKDEQPVRWINITNDYYIGETEVTQALSNVTGRKFRLPTEAEWEYAA